MSEIEKQAYEHAKRIGWDTQEAFDYAYALLIECNLHDEAQALKEKFDANSANVEEVLLTSATFRIQNADQTFLFAGTDANSWFTLSDARKIVNYEIGQKIVECDGENILWETL